MDVPDALLFLSASSPVSVSSSFSGLTSLNGSFRLYSGTSTMAYISPFWGLIVIAHTLFAFFSIWTFSAACVTYLCILRSSVVTRSFPGMGSVLVSEYSASSIPLASVTAFMLPFVPVSTLSYVTSRPSIP